MRRGQNADSRVLDTKRGFQVNNDIIGAILDAEGAIVEAQEPAKMGDWASVESWLATAQVHIDFALMLIEDTQSGEG